MDDRPGIKSQVEVAGFAIVDGILSDRQIAGLIEALAESPDNGSQLCRGSVFAVRSLLKVPAIALLAQSKAIRALVGDVLGDTFFPVRGILFDKIPDANWKVPWHQDVTIEVREKIEVESYGPWTMKAGAQSVQPPVEILEKMISVRLHLDECDESNGALRVVPGSHRKGRIPEGQIPAVVGDSVERACSVGKGGALLMRPLLLHASSPSQFPGHRRVIHLDFASVALDGGLRWLANPIAEDELHS